MSGMKFLIQLLTKLGMADYVAQQLRQPSGFFGSRFIGRMMNKGNADLEQFALASAHVAPSHHVMEIGFGNGKLLAKLCKLVSSGKVYGVDIAEDLLLQVEKRLHNQVENGHLQLHLAGVSKLPLADNCLDTIITNNTIYFWPQPVPDAQEMLRVLKPGGMLVCGYRTKEEMERYPFVTGNLSIFKNRYTDAEVKQLLLNAGFSEVAIKMKPSNLANSHLAISIK